MAGAFRATVERQQVRRVTGEHQTRATMGLIQRGIVGQRQRRLRSNLAGLVDLGFLESLDYPVTRALLRWLAFGRVFAATELAECIAELRAGALKFISPRRLGVVAEIYFAPVGGIGG